MYGTVRQKAAKAREKRSSSTRDATCRSFALIIILFGSVIFPEIKFYSYFFNYFLQYDDDGDPDDEICTPPELRALAMSAKSDALPKKSTKRYEQQYKEFCKWKMKYNTTLISENVLLAYFKELSTKRAPNTLWSTWSMLRTMLITRENINIKSFTQLKSFLTTTSRGYEPNKAKVFTDNQLDEFLEKAPNATYLVHKASFFVLST